MTRDDMLCSKNVCAAFALLPANVACILALHQTNAVTICACVHGRAFMLVSNHAKETNWGFSNCTCVQIVQYCSFKAEPIFDQQAMFDLLQTEIGRAHV